MIRKNKRIVLYGIFSIISLNACRTAPKNINISSANMPTEIPSAETIIKEELTPEPTVQAELPSLLNKVNEIAELHADNMIFLNKDTIINNWKLDSSIIENAIGFSSKEGSITRVYVVKSTDPPKLSSLFGEIVGGLRTTYSGDSAKLACINQYSVAFTSDYAVLVVSDNQDLKENIENIVENFLNISMNKS